MKNITREELNPVMMDESLDNDNSLRPILLNDFIGQNKIKENLKIFIESAKKRKVPLDHVLVYGPPGLGKTTISQIIANEMGVNFDFNSFVLNLPLFPKKIKNRHSPSYITFQNKTGWSAYKEWWGWQELINLIKEKKPNIEIYQIGGANDPQGDSVFRLLN
mgnify:CR=1 FL=1